jgi:NADPH2:quinone reductase
MSKAILVREHGDSNKLLYETVQLPKPAADEVRLRHHAIGLNFIDVYHRTGLYPPPSLPFIPGMEGAGIVEAVGENVSHLVVGDRVAYGAGPLGAYAEVRNIPAERLVEAKSLKKAQKKPRQASFRSESITPAICLPTK